MKYSFAIILLMIITQLPVACDSDPGEFEIIGIRANIGEVVSDRYNIQNRDFSSADTLRDTSLGIRINSQTQYVFHPNKFQNPFVSSAMAKPIPPAPADGMAIALISIYGEDTVFANNKVFAPGDALSTLFVALGDKKAQFSIPKYIETEQPWSAYDQIVQLQFAGALNKPMSQKLSVKITLKNSTELEGTTPKIVIKP